MPVTVAVPEPMSSAAPVLAVGGVGVVKLWTVTVSLVVPAVFVATTR